MNKILYIILISILIILIIKPNIEAYDHMDYVKLYEDRINIVRPRSYQTDGVSPAHKYIIHRYDKKYRFLKKLTDDLRNWNIEF